MNGGPPGSQELPGGGGQRVHVGLFGGPTVPPNGGYGVGGPVGRGSGGGRRGTKAGADPAADAGANSIDRSTQNRILCGCRRVRGKRGPKETTRSTPDPTSNGTTNESGKVRPRHPPVL